MSGFRTIFPKLPKGNAWYPIHMATGLRKVQRVLKHVDAVIEVHDARIPISGRSSSFHETVIGGRPHLLILNKMDLIDMNFKTDIDKKLLGTCDRILYTICKSDNKVNIDKIIPTLMEVVSSKPKFHRADSSEINMLIVGVPNVGKSSLINALRQAHLGKKGVMAVAPFAGVTKKVSEKLKISHTPPIYILDTPGILEPNLAMEESALRLALCGLYRDAAVGVEKMADYLLFWFNRRKLFHYTNILNLPEPCDNITEVLARICLDKNFLIKYKDKKTAEQRLTYDMHQAATYFVNLFRKGILGKYLLDDDLLYRTKSPNFQIAV